MYFQFHTKLPHYTSNVFALVRINCLVLSNMIYLYLQAILNPI